MLIAFIILMFLVFGKLLKVAIKASWGLLKICVYIVFLPLMLIGFLLKGLLMIAFPILIVIAIFVLIKHVIFR